MNNKKVRPSSKTGLTRANPVGDVPPLVVTKIRVPNRRRDLLPRRRLVDFIHAHLDSRLILISAPAGYGKTTLLTDFAHDAELPVCWYTLDAFDRDLRVFLEHLIAAITQRFPTFGERSRTFLQNVTDPSRNLYPLVATLVQEIYDAIPEYFVLVLDDHHTVEDQEQINEFIDLLVTYVDENCHLILASRTLPALPNLSLLLARRQATGLSIDELRFTPQEIRALAQQNYGLTLSMEQAGILAQQTGGWITGLLLTAVPLWEQAQLEIPRQGRISVSLYDYLSKQVLDQQPVPLRDFLLDSSILDELSVELCTEVLKVDKAADLMDQLRTRNLFVIEFEGDGGRLRYHDLFREFLQTSLRRRDDARFRELMRRAAQAYAARGEWERAVSRYLMLQEQEPMADIVERTAALMYERGRRETLASWIDALSETILIARPSLLVHRGKIHADQGEHGAAMALYQRAELAFTAAGDRAGVAYVLVIKGYLLRFQGRYAEAVAHCQQALTVLTGLAVGEKLTMALAHKNIGLCQLRLGRLAEGRKALQQAAHLYEVLANSFDMGMVHHDLGLSYELAGDLAGAVDHYQAALRCWQELGNPGPWASTLNSLGVVHYLRGEYDQALRLLTEALSKVQQAADLRVEAHIWASLGDLQRDLGALEQARQAYTEGLQVAIRANSGFILTYTLNALGAIACLKGDLVQAKSWLQRAMEQAEAHASNYEIALCHASLGVLYREEGSLAAAQSHLDQAIQIFQDCGFPQESGRAYLQSAQLAFLAGDREAAMADLTQALALVLQLGFDQFLVVEGVHLQPLLRYGAEQGIGGEVLLRLLRRIEAHQARMAERREPLVQAEPEPALTIYALGQPRVELAGEAVQWATTQSRDLFFCLLLHRQGLRREHIAEKFWPDHAPAKLDGIFRSTFYRLRRALFRDSVLFADGLYHFNREVDYWFDVEEFEGLLDRAGQAQTLDRLQEIALLGDALALYRGDYLEGVYHDWCVLERERLRGRYLAALETLARLYADRKDLHRAIELYQRLLVQDPYREPAHQALMRCYFRLGDRAAAIRQYQACANVLREELGLDPTPETEALYLQIID
jgi:ATP/maltotriose-dependent transcriptional regulator MalT